MAGTPLQYSYSACTVTVTTTKQSLLALIQAVGTRYANIAGSAAEFDLQPDPTNTVNILVGDENVAVSPQQCGAKLAASSGLAAAARMPYTAPLSQVYVIAASAGTSLLNVQVRQ